MRDYKGRVEGVVTIDKVSADVYLWRRADFTGTDLGDAKGLTGANACFMDESQAKQAITPLGRCVAPTLKVASDTTFAKRKPQYAIRLGPIFKLEALPMVFICRLIMRLQ